MILHSSKLPSSSFLLVRMKMKAPSPPEHETQFNFIIILDELPLPLQKVYLWFVWASLVAQMVKNLPAMQETPVRSVGWEHALEKEMAIHSSILAWRSPWTQELQSMRYFYAIFESSKH